MGWEATAETLAPVGESLGGLGARPGISQHGWGMAVDLDLDAPAQAWMRTNAVRFGFAEDTPREPWHWAFQPS